MPTWPRPWRTDRLIPSQRKEVFFVPIKIPDGLPAARTLASENIFVMSETRAVTQDIRPLRILVLNLMPTKIETETQLPRSTSSSSTRSLTR